jgi:hypothetical protein
VQIADFVAKELVPWVLSPPGRLRQSPQSIRRLLVGPGPLSKR